MGKYRSPFLAKSTMTTPFKKKGNWSAGYHTGEDRVCSNRTLVSPCDGTVSYNAYDADGYGYYIIIHTSDKRAILMAHFESKPSLAVGRSVKAGDKVGTMGSTGNSTGPHLHIEVQDSEEWNYAKNLLDPSDYIDFDDFSKEEKMDNTMKLNDSNNGVFAYKLLLLELKEYGVISQGVDANGVFGNGTLNATKQVQKLGGLKQTGVVDADTLRACKKLLDKAEAEKTATITTLNKKITSAKNALK